jgi:hypothetical protein
MVSPAPKMLVCLIQNFIDSLTASSIQHFKSFVPC